VREAAFQLIVDWCGTVGDSAGETLNDISFLDLYAGSGAVALEAASRGAAPVWAVEAEKPVAGVIAQNQARTGLRVNIATRKVEAFLAASPPETFDIVWVDPPYAVPNSKLAAHLGRLIEGQWLRPCALVILERSSRDAPPSWPAEMREYARRGYGETTLYLATTA
jgi:16S rRNA (guanine966-N2)-methyltransferase